MGSDLEKHLSRRSTRKQYLAPEIFPLTDLDNNLVGWDSQLDSQNPKNFSPSKKWTTLGLVASITFLSPLASSMFAPGVSFVNKEFHNTSAMVASFAVSVFVLGFAVSCRLFSVPLLARSLSSMTDFVSFAGRTTLPISFIRDLRAPYSSQHLQRRLLRLQSRLCISTQSAWPHYNALPRRHGRLCMSDHRLRRHLRFVSCGTARNSHGVVLTRCSVRPSARPHIRRLHCPASGLEMGLLRIVYRRMRAHNRLNVSAPREQRGSHPQPKDGATAKRTQSSRAPKHSYIQQGRYHT